MAEKQKSRPSNNSNAKKLKCGPIMTDEDIRNLNAEMAHLMELKKLNGIYDKLKKTDYYYANIVKQSIIGQDKGVEKLASIIYANLHANMIYDYYGEYVKHQTALIIGPSGCGKTETIRRLAEAFGLPFTTCNMTSYTAEGWVGKSVNSIISKLIIDAGNDVDLAERGIIYLEEIDKNASKEVNGAAGRDINGTEIQKELLKFFDRAPIEYSSKEPPFNTKLLTIIMGGRFIDIESIRNKRLNARNNIGFRKEEPRLEDDPEIDDETFRDLYNPYLQTSSLDYIPQDVIDCGFLSEFVGRINSIIEYHRLTRQNMIDIMLSKDSILQQYYRIFRLKGHELIIDDAVFENLADAALNDETGARNLESLLLNFLAPAIQDSANHYGHGIMEYDAYGNYSSEFQMKEDGRIVERYIPVIYPERHIAKENQ